MICPDTRKKASESVKRLYNCLNNLIMCIYSVYSVVFSSASLDTVDNLLRKKISFSGIKIG